MIGTQLSGCKFKPRFCLEVTLARLSSKPLRPVHCGSSLHFPAFDLPTFLGHLGLSDMRSRASYSQPATPITASQNMTTSLAPDLAVAQLCESWQKASFDDTTHPVDIWKAQVLHYRDRRISSTEYSFTDKLPELAGLEASARRGCDFCRFLRAIILSGDTNDVLVHDFGRGFVELGKRRIEIDISYDWRAKTRVGSAVGLMKIMLELESITTRIELQCFIEGAKGTDTSLPPSPI